MRAQFALEFMVSLNMLFLIFVISMFYVASLVVFKYQAFFSEGAKSIVSHVSASVEDVYSCGDGCSKHISLERTIKGLSYRLYACPSNVIFVKLGTLTFGSSLVAQTNVTNSCVLLGRSFDIKNVGGVVEFQ